MQNIVELPESAELFFCSTCIIIIENHEVKSSPGLFYWLNEAARGKLWNRAISEMKRTGISFEAMIETCASEFESRPQLLSILIWNYHIHTRDWDMITNFSTSDAGRGIEDMFVDEIRSCNDWDDFHDMVNPKNKFQKDINKHIRKEYNKQRPSKNIFKKFVFLKNCIENEVKTWYKT